MIRDCVEPNPEDVKEGALIAEMPFFLWLKENMGDKQWKFLDRLPEYLNETIKGGFNVRFHCLKSEHLTTYRRVFGYAYRDFGVKVNSTRGAFYEFRG